MKNLIFLLSISIFFYSCTDQTGGCTDYCADNYESFADFDDGSCFYPQVFGCTDPSATNYDPCATDEPVNGCDYVCEVVWYLTKSASDYMQLYGIDYYDFYLKYENTSFGYIANNFWFSGVPITGCIPQSDGSTLVQTFYWSGNYNNNAGVIQWEAWADDGTSTSILDYEGSDIAYPNDCIAIGLSGAQLRTYKEANKEIKKRERVLK